MSGKKYAVLIGINEYQYSEVPDLRGCVNDVEVIQSLLVNRFDFETERITRLVSADATRQNILAALAALPGRITNEQDIVVIYYSGHGSQALDREDDEPDGWDETIVPHDSGRADGHPNNDITDDEIYSNVREVTAKTPNVTLIFDSCHSGTITRDLGSGGYARNLPQDRRPADQQGRPDAAVSAEAVAELTALRKTSRTVGTSGWLPTHGRYVLIAGCRSDQLSYEYDVLPSDDGSPKVRHGALTYFLAQALQAATSSTTYQDVFELARRRVQSKFSQDPQLEGNGSQAVFGTRFLPAEPYFLVRSLQAESVTLEGGAAHGLLPDSLYALFPPGTNHPDGQPLANVTIRTVEAQTSVARADAALPASVEPGCRAFEVQTAYPFRKSVRVKAPDSPDVQELLDKVGGSKSLRLATSEDGTPDFTVYYLPERDKPVETAPVPQVGALGVPQWATTGPDGSLVAPLRPVADVDAVGIVLENLQKLARFRNVLGLYNPGSTLNGAVTLRLLRRDGAGRWSQAEPDARSGQLVLEDGEEFAVDIENLSGVQVYVSMLDLEAKGAVNVLYPYGGASNSFAANHRIRVGGGGNGGTLKAAFPENYPYFLDPALADGTVCTETFLALVTTNPADFRTLQQGGTRAVGMSKLPELLDAFAGEIGEATNYKAVFLPPSTWATTAVSFVVRRPTRAITATGSAAPTAEVTVGPHPTFRAEVRVAEVAAQGRNLDMLVPPVLADSGVDVLAFGPRARGLVGAPGHSIVELTNAENYGEVTPDAPLELTIRGSFDPRDAVLALGWDGAYHLPLGYVPRIQSAEAVTIPLVRLPEPTANGQKDVLGSIRILLTKLAHRTFGLPYDYPHLAEVTISPEGKPTYVTTDPAALRAKVAVARRIVLYVHGIFGDTREMAASAIRSGVTGPDDLVLAFDYENLNGGVADAALQLKLRLGAIGLDGTGGRGISIVAHSMGGLVSRWFIEALDGKAVVQRLILLGTPSGGSPWPKVQDAVFWGVGLVLNGLTKVSPTACTVAGILGAVDRANVNLDDMAPGSPFLQQLASLPDPGVPYWVIAGNTVTILPPQAAGLLARLFKPGFYQGLTALFGGEPNDIAVSIASMNAIPGGRVPAPVRQEVPTDHLSYFGDAIALAAVQAALEG